jgi:hypothetical protein
MSRMVSQKTILRFNRASPRLPTTDLFLAVITSATEVGNTRPTANFPESVARIHEVNFYCLTSSVWDDLSLVGDALPSPSYTEHVDVMALRDPHDAYQQNSAQPPQPPPVFEHPCSALKKILSSGSFYYALSPHWDISSRLTERLSRDRSEAHDLGAFDERFVWNEYIVRSLLDFRERLDIKEREDLDKCQFIVSLFVVAAAFGIGCFMGFSPWRDRSLPSKATRACLRSRSLRLRRMALRPSRLSV